MSELHFDFDYVRSLNYARLDFLYKEAKRQRADKAFSLYNLIQTLVLDKDDVKSVYEGLKQQLNPHKITHIPSAQEAKIGWALLRSRRR